MENDIVYTHNLGLWGEKKAAELLRQKGFRIKFERLRIGGIEMDIVAESPDTLAIVEVKTRSYGSVLAPEFSVSRLQIQRLMKAADIFACKYNVQKDIRFDVIAIIKNEKEELIKHIENAYVPL